MRRNGKLDFLKFVFAVFIMSYHYCWYPLISKVGQELHFAQNGGYAVMFFFLVSGAFFAASAKEKSNEVVNLADDTQRFMRRKYRYFIKYYLVAVIFYFLEDIFWKSGLKRAFLHLLYTLPSMFLLGEAGFDNKEIYVSGYYIGASWYLSALFLVLLIFYPMIRMNYNTFTKVLAPIIFAGTLFFNLRIFHNNLEGILYPWCVMSLGIIIYEQSNNIYKWKVNKKVWILLEIVLYGIFLLFLCTGVQPESMVDYPMLFICGGAIMISLSEITHYKVFEHKIFTFLGEASFPLYLLHTPVFRWYEDIYTFWGIKNEGAGIYFPAAFTAILLAVVLTLGSKKWSKEIKKKFKLRAKENDISDN